MSYGRIMALITAVTVQGCPLTPVELATCVNKASDVSCSVISVKESDV
jgi:hypothetical protein